ncbi:hypothetical protein EV426DRAFT_12077 [Tirmania nivea]|nr:hypothetical protein EV426DRAFT_12077 [Tirmania nivea]
MHASEAYSLKCYYVRGGYTYGNKYCKHRFLTGFFVWRARICGQWENLYGQSTSRLQFFLLDTSTVRKYLLLPFISPRPDLYSDDSYKVVVFDVDNLGVDGKILDVVCRDQSDPHGVSDELLRWHFRQSILANMRGAGEPVFEHDFVGKDMVREISSGQYGQERFRNGSGSEIIWILLSIFFILIEFSIF